MRITAPPAVKVNVVEPRPRPDRRRKRRDMQRVGALADDLDVIDMGLIADEHFERSVGLIAAAGRPLVAFDQHHARALADRHQRTGETRRRLFRRGEHEMQRPLDGRAGAHADDGAVAHQRGVERDRNVARGRELAEMPHQLVVVLGERGGERSERKPVFQRCRVGQFRHERAVDKNKPQRLALVEQRARALGARLRLRIGRASPAALRRASARADRCISSPRRGDAAGLRVRTRRTRPPAPSRSPRRPADAARACANVCASAVSAAVLMTFSSAMAASPQDDPRGYRAHAATSSA